MEKFKGKYEIILGFVTLVISLSAFKDELNKISISDSFIDFTLADYFLYVVCGFSTCLYLYVIEHAARDTKIGNWKVFDYVTSIAYYLFVFILATPLLILLNIISVKLYKLIFNYNEQFQDDIPLIAKIIPAIIIAFIAKIFTNWLDERMKKERSEEIEIKQIKELENANKLLSDGYYSHSVLESYKAIETYLYKKILQKGIRAQPNRFNDLVKIAIQQNIISERELPAINDIRGMRNAAAHTNTAYTKQQAEFALNFVRQLFVKND